MCTLIVGRDVPAPGVTVLGANRDEDPARPSDPPRRLAMEPAVAGGRDRIAGGTWLAVRRGAVVAMLNRRSPPRSPAPPGATPPRSRGLLALDVATLPATADFADAARTAARERVAAAGYAPFSLVVVTPVTAWVLRHDSSDTRIVEIPPGWHVLTHTELDDPEEPRAARLLRELASFAPRDEEEALAGVRAHLARHDPPAVCLHEGVMCTVSFALAALGPGRMRYLHGEGRPCTTTAIDYSHLLEEERHG